MAEQNTFVLKFNNFNLGASPIMHLDSLTEIGNPGHYSVATNIDVISTPGKITQGPGLLTLTNGASGVSGYSGVVTELVNYILDIAPASNSTYGIGNTKLFQLSSTTVTSATSGVSGATTTFPRVIANATGGNSLAYLKGYLFYFYNKSSGGEIGRYDLGTTFVDGWGTGTPGAGTGPIGGVALISVPHPVATKEDIMLFGNGRYCGNYFSSTNTINTTKLDFGNNNEVADVCFSANNWFIAVNNGITGTNRNSSSIYMYDGGAITTYLSDEAAVGVQKIGFLYPLGGVVYVAYQDMTFTNGYKIGYLNGRKIEPLGSFSGSLPTFAQKTLFKNTILFLSGGLVYSAGAVVPDLPFAISQHADGGFATAGAIACPFGTPLIASSDGVSGYKMAGFSGYDTNCAWKSIVIPLVSGRSLGFIDDIVVLTGTLAANASATITLEYNQNSSTSSAQSITGTGLRRFKFPIASGGKEDVRVALSWSGGNTIADCPIREIQVTGHWVEA